MNLRIPSYAKNKAREGLDERRSLPQSRRFGIDKSEANRLGIASGVERARQIIRNKTLPESDGKKVARFYSRFKNCDTTKCEGSLKLWGGRRFGKEAYNKYYG